MPACTHRPGARCGPTGLGSTERSSAGAEHGTLHVRWLRLPALLRATGEPDNGLQATCFTAPTALAMITASGFNRRKKSHACAADWPRPQGTFRNLDGGFSSVRDRDRRASPAGSAPIVSRQQHAALQVKNQDGGARHGSRSCRFRPNSYWVAPGAATRTAPPLTAAASAAACFFSSAATTVASPAGSQALKVQCRILR